MEFGWSRVADEYEQVYAGLISRRHDTRGNDQVRARLVSRRLIDVDLHMHTDHSYDCATPVEVFLAEGRAPAASGRSPSPTTTRSRAPTPRGPRHTASG